MIDVRFLQSKNAPSEISVTLSGSFTDFTFRLFANAYAATIVVPLGTEADACALLYLSSTLFMEIYAPFCAESHGVSSNA